MKIGITGARGLIGKRLTALLVEKGHEAVLYTRNVDEVFSPGHELRHFSPELAEQTDVSGLDALVHLAGESVLGIWTAAKKQQIRSSRLLGTQGLVKAMKDSERAPQVFVCASGTGFYGDRADEVLTEESELGRGFLAEVTQVWESAAMQAQDDGIRVVCGRVGMALGAGGGAAPLLRKLFRLGLGGRLGSGKQWMPWVHVDDVARMFLYAIEQTALEGAVNFCAPKSLSNSEFTRVLARQVKRPAIAWAPAPLLKLVLGGMSEMLLFSERVVPEVLKQQGFDWDYEDLGDALSQAMRKT
ncbi:MAG: TIGR01777 family oxidoreductase [Verrucomicrobiota bacterium]